MRPWIFSLFFIIVIVVSSCEQEKTTLKKSIQSPETPTIQNHDENPDTLIVDSSDILEYYDTSDDTAYYEEGYQMEYPMLDSSLTGLNFKAAGSYVNLKSIISADRQAIKELFITLSDSTEIQKFTDSIGHYLTNILLDDIFPHWYGTEWDYNGITETPGKGYVACGYFISTTLRDLGLNMNRYKFAQQTGLNGAKTLQLGEDVKKFYTNNNDIPARMVKELKPGLYQVGLSCHVGYLLIRNSEAWFIHSNYIHSGVMVELARDSEAFDSNVYVISEITYNRKLIKKWILGERMTIICD